MKRRLIFSLLLFSLTIGLAAQDNAPTKNSFCSKVVSLKGGGLTLGPPFSNFPYDTVTVTSFLTAPGYTITSLTGDEPANTGIGTVCNASSVDGGCTPTRISAEIQSGFGIIAFPPNGGMLVNGQAVRMWGFPGFVATSFNSSVDADGNLLVFGDAVGYGGLNECDASCTFPLPDNVCFDFGKTSWQYSGQFIPNPYPINEGSYDFSFMTIVSKHPVKLPATGN